MSAALVDEAFGTRFTQTAKNIEAQVRLVLPSVPAALPSGG